MPSKPETGVASQHAMQDVLDILDQGVALFDGEARLIHANARFVALYPSLSDLLKPGLLWGIFLHEAVQRGAMSLTVSQQLDALESGLEPGGAPGTPLQVPAPGEKIYVLSLTPTSGDGFAITQRIDPKAHSGSDPQREIETLMRKVLEACPVSLTMSRIADGQVLYRSPAATELLGTAKSSFAHFARREERADYVTALLSDAAVENMRVTCLDADGNEFPAELSARLIDYRGEDVIVTNIEDISRELNTQLELDRRKEQLFQSEKLSALGELLAGVAHELNNPLSIVVGNADLLEEELEGSLLSHRVEKLSKAAHRCVRIVRSFLSLVRQEPLNLQHVAPARILETACEAVASDLEKQGILLRVDDASDGREIVADETQVTQVLINLLTNAIHAIRDAGQGDQIFVMCQPGKGMLLISVSDNGPGVDDEIKTRIFDPLFTTKQIGKGTGVGLAYCHRIITAHGGAIRLENTANKGATFVVEMPTKD